MIPYGRQSISDEDVAAVVAALRSDFLTQGPIGPAFEEALAKACGAQFAVSMCNATAALHLACLALDVGPGDRVWTSPISFVASANCALYCGAEVDFVDIDPETFNLSPAALEEKLVQAERAGQLPKLVIAVHMGGQSCDMEAIHALGQRFGFRIVEDASHAVGATYRGEPVGNCRFSDIAVFSFHPVKIITTGEGGAALTNDRELARRLAVLRTHGITRDPAEFDRGGAPGFYYEQQWLGFNYRLTDLQSALGLSQLGRLPDFIARRRVLADRYDQLLADLPVAPPGRSNQAESSWHLYIVRVREEQSARTRDEAFGWLRDHGIGVNLHYIPIYLQPYYRRLGFEPGLCPAAEAYYASAMTIPLFAAMRDEEQREVVERLGECLLG